MALLLSPSISGWSPISCYLGQTVQLDKNYKVTKENDEVHIQLYNLGDSLKIKQVVGTTHVYFAKNDTDPYPLLVGEELALPLGGAIEVKSKQEAYFLLERESDKRKETSKDENEETTLDDEVDRILQEVEDDNKKKYAQKEKEEEKEEEKKEKEKKESKRKLCESDDEGEPDESDVGDKRKIEEVMATVPDCDEITVAIALCENGGKVEKTIHSLLENSSKRKKPNENEEEESASLAVALQLQEEEEARDAKNQYSEFSPYDEMSERRELIVIPLEYGVVLFKNCLSVDQQLGIYSQCLELSDTKSHLKAVPNSTYPSVLCTLNWMGMKKRELPEDLVQFAKDTHRVGYNTYKKNKDIHNDVNPAFVVPSSFNPIALHSIMYPVGGKLHSHQDGAVGWVLSVSVGCSCIFSCNLQSGRKQTIQIDSGDVVLFNGQSVYHEVERILPNTAPDFWGKTCETYGFARFNLQFRDLSVQTQI